MDFKLNKSNLNFRVYTASSIPATGTENDICIVSEVSMSNWIMSPDKPSGIPRSDGDVWIQYSVTGDTFNALKQNTMMIATISAWQYADGAWSDVPARSYQNGEWTNWFVYLFDYGNQTYRWQTRGWKHSDASHVEQTPTITNNTDGSMTFSITAANANFFGGGGVEIAEDVDLTGISSLDIECNVTSNATKGSQNATLIVVPRNATYWKPSAVAVTDIPAGNSGEPVKLNVSSISGSYDIALMIYINGYTSGACTVTCRVNRIKANWR